MKILLVSSFLPFPLYSGGQVRLYNIMKKLQEKHDVTLVCEIRNSQTQDDIFEVEKVCKKVMVIPRKKQWSLQNITKTGFSKKPFLLTGHNLPEMMTRISEELKDNAYDLIHVETFYVYQNLPPVSIPVVLVEHNIEYTIYQRFTNKAPFFLRPLLSLDVAKLRTSEEYYWKKADIVVAVSADEEKIIQEITDKTAVVANGVDVEKFTVKSEQFTVSGEKKLLFIGDFKYIQNQDSVMWILDEVFPTIQEKLGQKVRLWIVGRNMNDMLRKRASTQIIIDENSPLSTPEIFRKADVLLAPIRVGGGTSYKILEAMASGTPVITTSLGNEGIGGEHTKDIMIADTPVGMVSHVVELLSDEKLYNSIATNARKVVEENFSWEKIGKDLEEVYKRVIKVEQKYD